MFLERYRQWRTTPVVQGQLGWVILVVILALLVSISVSDIDTEQNSESSDRYQSEKKCDIAGVSIQGDIVNHTSEDDSTADYASAEEITYTLRSVQESGEYSVVLLDISSYGGESAAAKEIADYVAQMSIPVVASIRGAATSGGYYIASQADQIFAAPLTDIGGIGVTMSYLDQVENNNKEGYNWNSLSIGSFKDSGSSNKTLTQAERDIFMRDVQIVYDQFVSDVARGRKLSIDTVRTLADGSTVLAERAKELGLVDQVAQQWEVEQYIANTYDIDTAVCWQ